jgi:uncharacterized membrane protein
MAEEPENAQADGHGGSILDALKSKELLVPAALSAVGAVAASKGPDLLRRLTEESEAKGEEEAEKLGKHAAEGAKSGLAGGGKGMLGKMASKALPGGGGGDGKKTRRLPIQRWTDVAVPIETAYEAWTSFDDFPKFMHRVLNVRRRGDDRVQWQEKIWFSKRNWEGRITDRRENDRIAWKTTNGMSHKGVVSFHKLDDNLTRVMVDMEFEPNGMIEKMASGMRFVKRAVEADLARFKAYVEMKDAKGIDYRSSSGPDERRERGDDKDDERRERENRRKERQQTTGSRS